jgi:hypothetical protein
MLKIPLPKKIEKFMDAFVMWSSFTIGMLFLLGLLFSGILWEVTVFALKSFLNAMLAQ